MKKILLGSALLMACLYLAPALSAKPVKVIMKDGSIINGDMLGLDAGVLTLETSPGKSKDIKTDKIKKVFDADGKTVGLSASAASTASTEEAEAAESFQEEPAPAPKAKKPARARKSGAKTAGTIMTISGLGVFLVGGVIWFVGNSQMDSATSTYYTGYSSYYGIVYQIPGKPGYYKSDQYYNYYSGQGVSYVGAGVTLVGAAVAITGLIVGSSGPKEQASLMDIQDGQVAWSVPEVQFAPDLSPRMTLLTAQF